MVFIELGKMFITQSFPEKYSLVNLFWQNSSILPVKSRVYIKKNYLLKCYFITQFNLKTMLLIKFSDKGDDLESCYTLYALYSTYHKYNTQ